MDARSLVMGYAAARTVTDDPQTLNQSAILGAVLDGRPIVSFVVAQQYARSQTPASGQASVPAGGAPSGSSPTPPPTVAVPDLSGAKDEKEMQTRLAAVQLTLTITRQPGNDNAPQPGDFVSQSPAAGTPVLRNTSVTVTLSKGLAVMVPPIEPHITVSDLVELLLKKGISVEAVPVYVAEDAYEPDEVVALRPPSGSLVYPGDEVTAEVQEDRRHAGKLAVERKGK